MTTKALAFLWRERWVLLFIMAGAYTFDDIKDQVVVITGSGRGIGKATAELFAAHGAKLVISDMDTEVCEQTAEELKKSGTEAIGVVANVTKEEDVAKLMKAPIDKWGRIDCLVNNAGLTKDTLFIRMKIEQWKLVMDVNLNGAYLCAKEAVNYMRKARKGSIINLSSISRVGNPGQANYSSAKAGVVALSATMAKELGPLGIRVNCVLPGFTETRLVAQMPDKIREESKNVVPLKRHALPEEIAYPILFLSSRMASYVSGATLEVHGGGVPI